jgi:hypothetical protein
MANLPRTTHSLTRWQSPIDIQHIWTRHASGHISWTPTEQIPLGLAFAVCQVIPTSLMVDVLMIHLLSFLLRRHQIDLRESS